jgi:hypothetical protein
MVALQPGAHRNSGLDPTERIRRYLTSSQDKGGVMTSVLIVLLMCTPYGDMMRVKSIEASEAAMSHPDAYAAIMDRRPTCAQKIAQLTQLADGETLQCTPTSAVPFPIKDTLFTLSCHFTDLK